MSALTIPGTPLPFERSGGMFEVFKPLIKAADGLTLGQVCSVTGLEPSTVQNWVKRGFVARPVQKKYRERQLARILLISSLRESMKIDSIGELMKMVNGSANDEADDIISEEKLYDYFCEAVLKISDSRTTDCAGEIISNVISSYSGPTGEAKERLELALSVMLSAYVSALYKKEAEEKFNEMIKKVNNEQEN